MLTRQGYIKEQKHDETHLCTGTSTPARAANSHSQQAIAVSMPCSVNILSGDQQRWCRSCGSQSRDQPGEKTHKKTQQSNNKSSPYLKEYRVMFLAQNYGEGVKPLVLMSKAASLNMASVNASGCAESKASPICLIMSRFRSGCPRTAWAKWIIPETYRQKKRRYEQDKSLCSTGPVCDHLF